MGRGTPPAYIFSILADRVLLSGDLSAVFRMLRDSPYRARTARETPSTVAVCLAPPGADDGENDFHALLRWLSDHGVAFAEKHHGAISIVTIARRLQQSGALPRRIAVIRWSSQDEWKVGQESLDAAAPAATVSM